MAIGPNNLILKQGDYELIITKDLFKELPFNHAKEAPNISGQGLIYLSPNNKINPQLPIELIYIINNDENQSVKFNLSYLLPNKYYIKDFSIKTKKTLKTNNSLKEIWKRNIINTCLLVLTILLASFVLFYNNSITQNRNRFFLFRVFFLSWILIWLGWIVGGQISIIHLMNFILLDPRSVADA